MGQFRCLLAIVIAGQLKGVRRVLVMDPPGLEVRIFPGLVVIGDKRLGLHERLFTEFFIDRCKGEQRLCRQLRGFERLVGPQELQRLVVSPPTELPFNMDVTQVVGKLFAAAVPLRHLLAKDPLDRTLKPLHRLRETVVAIRLGVPKADERCDRRRAQLVAFIGLAVVVISLLKGTGHTLGQDDIPKGHHDARVQRIAIRKVILCGTQVKPGVFKLAKVRIRLTKPDLKRREFLLGRPLIRQL